MNSWEQDRRSKLKHKYIRGTKKRTSGARGLVNLVDVSGTGISRLEITGKSTFTEQTPSQLIKHHISQAQLYPSDVDGAMCMPLPLYLDGKEITVSVTNSQAVKDFEFYLASGSEFLFSNTEQYHIFHSTTVPYRLPMHHCRCIYH